MDVASGEHTVLESAGDPAGEQAVIEDILGRPTKKGALKRGFKTLPRILPYLRPYRKLATISVILTILLAVVALAEPWPLAFVVDSIIGDEPAPGWVSSIFGSSVGALIALAVVATLFLTLLMGAMTVWNEYLLTTIDQRMVLDFRSEMFQHAQKLSLAFHDSSSKGILMYRINNMAASMGQIVTSIPAVAQSVLTLIGMVFISIKINPLLALLALGTTPFIVYSTTFYTDRIEPRIYRVRGLGAMNLAIVYEAMAMMRVVLAFGTQRREFSRFRKQGETWADETVGLTVRQTVFKLAVQLITSAGTAAVIGVGAYQAINGHITAGELLVVLSYIAMIYQPLEELTNTIASFQEWFIGMLMSFELMDTKPEIKDKPDAKPLRRARGEIELEGVGFGYQSRPGVLKDVSLRIPPGGAVAMVGPTGAGKSTLVSLLPRFYDAKEGTVRLDGDDVRDLKVADVRNQFSIVLQEPLLFSGTIANNISYGKPEASMEEVVEAAKAANAHDFISELPDGYKTRLGEGGAKISGGERQRIAVARAFLRDAPILILDEPTSSIDSHTEAVILDALDRLMQGRTTIVIAHRLSTLRSVDKIIVMDQGAIVQEGTHQELAIQPGMYRQLWEAQTLWEARTRAGDRHPLRPTAAELDGEPLQPALATVARLDAPTAESRKDGVATYAVAAPRHDPLRETESSTGRGPMPGSTASPRPKVVLLGMLTRIPVGGVGWLVGHYAAGFERLGYEVYYVEAHARTPTMFMRHQGDDGTRRAVRYLAAVAERFGLENRWAFQALHENGRCYGMGADQLDRLYRDAALIINMHGGTLPLPEHAATDRLVFLGTDPVEVELEVERGDKRALEFLDQHVAHFTWGLNYGNPDCELPWARPYSFVPSPPPVVLDFWKNDLAPDNAPFTTIGNWRQHYRDVRFENRVFRWSKHQQFMKILDLPMRTQARIELALSSYEGRDRLLLAEHGWRVRPGLEISRDLDSYRDYIIRSAGEISAAKEQNVHFRTGWFSERSATYLAAGRPVILEDTGFGGALPTGEGLFSFTGLDDATEAISAVQADPDRHRRAALEIAREYLSHDVVLGDLLDHMGLQRRHRVRSRERLSAPAQIPPELPLQVRGRRPLALPDETADAVQRRPIPTVSAPTGRPVASVVVPVLDNLVCARLALESVLANTDQPAYEVVVVRNGSSEPTRQYLEALAARNRHVRVIQSEPNVGFATACNEGLSSAAGQILVLLSGDTVVPPGWLAGLTEQLTDETIGLVGPTTNRCGGQAKISTSYCTYAEMLRFARQRADAWSDRAPVDIAVAEMFCAAMPWDVFEAAGPLDGRFDVGMFEDDDYARRVRDAGFRVVCAGGLFVHRFGDASPGAGSEDPETAIIPERSQPTDSRLAAGRKA